MSYLTKMNRGDFSPLVLDAGSAGNTVYYGFYCAYHVGSFDVSQDGVNWSQLYSFQGWGGSGTMTGYRYYRIRTITSDNGSAIVGYLLCLK